MSDDHVELQRQANQVMHDFEQQLDVYSVASRAEDPGELRALALRFMSMIDTTEAKLLDLADQFAAMAARTTDLIERVVLMDEVRIMRDQAAQTHNLCQLPPR